MVVNIEVLCNTSTDRFSILNVVTGERKAVQANTARALSTLIYGTDRGYKKFSNAKDLQAYKGEANAF